jgi:hypothetical protein
MGLGASNPHASTDQWLKTAFSYEEVAMSKLCAAQHIEAQLEPEDLGLAEVHGHRLMISGRGRQVLAFNCLQPLGAWPGIDRLGQRRGNCKNHRPPTDA